jgi:hypothetical protein
MEQQKAAIRAMAKVQPKVIVVLKNGALVVMSASIDSLYLHV